MYRKLSSADCVTGSVSTVHSVNVVHDLQNALHDFATIIVKIRFWSELGLGLVVRVGVTFRSEICKTVHARFRNSAAHFANCAG